MSNTGNAKEPSFGEEGHKDIYCRVCTGCGEDGCCSALICSQDKDGLYCETYLLELKFAYLMYRDMFEVLYKGNEVVIDKIYDINYDKVFRREENNKGQD